MADPVFKICRFQFRRKVGTQILGMYNLIRAIVVGIAVLSTGSSLIGIHEMEINEKGNETIKAYFYESFSLCIYLTFVSICYFLFGFFLLLVNYMKDAGSPLFLVLKYSLFVELIHELLSISLWKHIPYYAFYNLIFLSLQLVFLNAAYDYHRKNTCSPCQEVKAKHRSTHHTGDQSETSPSSPTLSSSVSTSTVM